MAARIHTGTIRVCPRCAATREEPYEFRGRYVPVGLANALEVENEKLREEIQKLKEERKSYD